MHCAFCGTTCKDQDASCPKCNERLVPIDAYRAVAGQRFAGGRAVAHLGDRLLAQIFDALLFAVLFVVLLMAALHYFRVGAIDFSAWRQMPTVAVYGTLLAAVFFYFWLFEGWFGLTLGKGLVGIQVHAVDGARAGLKASLIRNFLRIIDWMVLYLVGFLVALSNKRRQRLGDLLAGTVVVEKRLHWAWYLLVFLLWAGSIAAGIWGAWTLQIAEVRPSLRPPGIIFPQFAPAATATPAPTEPPASAPAEAATPAAAETPAAVESASPAPAVEQTAAPAEAETPQTPEQPPIAG